MMGSTRLKNFFVAEATSVTALSTDCMEISFELAKLVGRGGQLIVALATAILHFIRRR
jgi:hypothetical protein